MAEKYNMHAFDFSSMFKIPVHYLYQKLSEMVLNGNVGAVNVNLRSCSWQNKHYRRR